MNIVALIRSYEAADHDYRQASKVAREQILSSRVAPPSAGEFPREAGAFASLEHAKQAWFDAILAIQRHEDLGEDDADDVPSVAALKQRRAAALSQMWDAIDANGTFTVGSVPGLMPCPVCDSNCVGIPSTRERSSWLAVCEANETHLVRWTPWGG